LVERAVERGVSFAYETVFSYFEEQPDGSYRSKGDLIAKFQQAGYAVALLFVGLANATISILRVETRREQGGHAVPMEKLQQRFPRTQKAIRMAAPFADLTLMFDNSRTPEQAFSLVRAQAKSTVHYDCRTSETADKDLIRVADAWLSVVAPKKN
jgi:predicted ABC-type ATPase